MARRSKSGSSGAGAAGEPAVSGPLVSRGSTSKRYSPAERQALLDEFERSGLTQTTFCARRGGVPGFGPEAPR